MQMPSFTLVKSVSPILCALAIVACGPPDEASRARSGPIVGAFLVSDYYTPSGLMGDGQTPGLLTEEINQNCKARPPGAQGDCYHFVHHIGDLRWSGAYWVYPANSWGTVPGRDLIGPVDRGMDSTGKPLRGYNRVRFWAAIDPLPVPPKFNAFVGGIDGSTAVPPRPYTDQGYQIFAADPTTTPPTPQQAFFVNFRQAATAEIGPEWKQYEIPLEGWAVDNVIGGFGWSINDNDNLGQTISLYFDGIVWE